MTATLSRVERHLYHAVVGGRWRGLSRAAAAVRWRVYRVTYGYGRSATHLLTPPDAQPKTGKNDTPTYVLHLLPAAMFRKGWTLCTRSTRGCRAGCLNTAGRGQMFPVHHGRASRTGLLLDHPAVFVALLVAEITAAVKRHPDGIAIRLNGTSDIRWELVYPGLFEEFPGVQFYDYTKHASRVTPPNYALTYSVSERDTDPDTLRAVAVRISRVAVVVDTPAPVGGGEYLPLPATWWGLPVIDGDVHDMRLEPGPVAVLLRAKGSIRNTPGTVEGFVKPTRGNP